MTTDREMQLLQAATEAGITSKTELANFMAQVGHESGGLIRLEEGFRYTKGTWQIPVRSAMREGKEALEEARLEALQGKPEKLGELMYGGRMGNDEPGDGYKFHGRGYMQLTGKDNYGKRSQVHFLFPKGNDPIFGQCKFFYPDFTKCWSIRRTQ